MFRNYHHATALPRWSLIEAFTINSNWILMAPSRTILWLMYHVTFVSVTHSFTLGWIGADSIKDVSLNKRFLSGVWIQKLMRHPPCLLILQAISSSSRVHALSRAALSSSRNSLTSRFAVSGSTLHCYFANLSVWMAILETDVLS